MNSKSNYNQMEVGPSQQVVQLTEVDVPGALLEETMDKHSIPALKWWLLCHGIEISSFVRTGQCKYHLHYHVYGC